MLMKNFKKYSLIFILYFCSIYFPIITKASELPTIKAEQALAIEMSTGKILYQKNADKKVPIASITKLLTIYLVYQDIERHKLSWSTKVSISDYAHQLLENKELSNVPMSKREYTVKELVEAALVSSSNTAAIALAEHISGSESQFVNRMRDQLDSWGITNHLIVNSSGLNNKYLGKNIYPDSKTSDENLLSAKDLATIARHLLTDFPEILTITSQAKISFDGQTVTSSNQMLPSMAKTYSGIDGLKTGTTEQSGPSFIATATINQMRVFTLILHATDNEDDYNRFTETAHLLDYIKQHFELTTILKKGQAKQSTVTILDGKTNKVTLVAQSNLTIVKEKDKTLEKLTFTPLKSVITAPIEKNQTLGKVTYGDDQKDYLEEELVSVNMNSPIAIEESDFGKIFPLDLQSSL